MSGQCRDCKFWSRDSDHHHFEGTVWGGLGICEAAPELWTRLEYDADREEQFSEDGKKRLAFVNDGSRYMAELLCRPDFGCVQFEPKP